MKKAPSTILATAGLTVGMLGFALPASAATAVTPNPIITPGGGFKTPPPGGGTQTPPPGGGTKTPPPGGGTQTPPPGGGTKTPPPGGGTKTPPPDKGGSGGKGGFGGGKGGGQGGDSGKGGSGGKGGFGGGKTPPKHHPRPVQHPKPKPKPTPICHPQAPKPKYPVKPIGYNKGSNKYKEYTAAVYSWEHPKSGHTVKCDPKPVKHPAPPKHPVKHPAPPKHHHAPKKHWWNIFG